ncbi:MAG: hypothetical protein AB4352_15070 [Hormoscilla sp.]
MPCPYIFIAIANNLDIASAIAFSLSTVNITFCIRSGHNRGTA